MIESNSPVTRTRNSSGVNAIRPNSAGNRGLAIAQAKFSQAKQEQEANYKKQEYSKRFWLGKNSLGVRKPIVVLDNDINDIVSVYEHEVYMSNKTVTHDVCVNHLGNAKPFNCVLCEKGETPSLVVLLTILDLTPYVTREGQTVPYSRKLLPIKQQSMPLFSQLLQGCQQEFGSIRGMYLELQRDDNGNNSPKIGQPQMLKNNKFFNYIDDAQLLEKFKHGSILNAQGREIVKPNELLRVMDYDKFLEVLPHHYYLNKYASHGGGVNDYTTSSYTPSLDDNTPQKSNMVGFNPMTLTEGSDEVTQPADGGFGDETI